MGVYIYRNLVDKMVTTTLANPSPGSLQVAFGQLVDASLAFVFCIGLVIMQMLGLLEAAWASRSLGWGS